MRLYFIISFIFFYSSISSQGLGFDCDASLYIISYTQSTGISTLYRVQENSEEFSFEEIDLSQERRLNSLAYNVNDKYLYALDVDSYELVKIDRIGKVTSLGVPDNMDQSFIYNSATISPNGSGIYLIGYDPAFNYDTRFYTINLSRENYYMGFLGVTGDRRAEIHDLATDPLSGQLFGYDNLDGSLKQMAIGGQISSVDYPTTGEKSMDGIFFNQKGELFGYASGRGIYAIDKLNGELTFLSSGPKGTNGDACSCPYTSVFTKDVSPREILPCEEFIITYSFQNHLGIGQTWVKIRDTLPEGFEILNIESKIVSSINILDVAPNILALDNLIYLLGDNEIRVTVKAPLDYIGEFSSRATNWDFPKAFGEYHYSDDLSTEELQDPTIAHIITQDELDFSNSISYSCDGESAIIESPISAQSYQWNTGSEESFISVDETGWYTLKAQGECGPYRDSVLIEYFPDRKMATIVGPTEVILGTTIELSAQLDRGIPISYTWITSPKDSFQCIACRTIQVKPSIDFAYKLRMMDEDGCITEDEHGVVVNIKRDFYAATAFSPNGDAINDHFFLQSSVDGIIKKMTVYNRWGSVVFSTEDVSLNDATLGWNGKVNEEIVDSGVYVWVAEIEYFDGYVEQKSGSITLFGDR